MSLMGDPINLPVSVYMQDNHFETKKYTVVILQCKPMFAGESILEEAFLHVSDGTRGKPLT